MDEVARVVSTAFTLSNDLRRDTTVTVLFCAEPPPKARRIDLNGERLRYLNPDERSTAALLKNALVRSVSFPSPLEVSPGLVVAPVDPIAALTQFARAPDALWLTEDGEPLEGWESPTGAFSAILSDPTDPTPEEAEALRGAGVPRLRLGPRSLRSSQCVDVLHNVFDRRESARPIPPAPRADD